MNTSKTPKTSNKAVDTEALVNALVQKNLEVRRPIDHCYFCDLA